jgi:dTDP-4-dehydrorhamnose reductase
MRIVVLGAGGLLGRDLCPTLAARHEVTGLTHADADITDLAALTERFRTLKPELVINCAAATNVDRCEKEPEWAYRVNDWGAWSVASATEAVGARLIHLSTDFVFPGNAGRAYSECDTPAPINQYGASKLAGEQAAMRACHHTSIVRTQQLFGLGGRSFPRALLDAARRDPGKGLRVVVDQYAVPTYTRHLARKLAWLAEWPADGLYHLNNAGECTRHEWATELLRQARLGHVPISPILASEWPAPAPRPARSTLRRHALELMGADDMPPWQEGTGEFLAELRAAGEL